MYDETFKDALYGAFQPADEKYDPSFLVRLLEYFQIGRASCRERV